MKQKPSNYFSILLRKILNFIPVYVVKPHLKKKKMKETALLVI